MNTCTLGPTTRHESFMGNMLSLMLEWERLFVGNLALWHNTIRTWYFFKPRLIIFHTNYFFSVKYITPNKHLVQSQSHSPQISGQKFTNRTSGNFPVSYVVRYFPRLLKSSQSNNRKISFKTSSKKVLNLHEAWGQRHVTKMHGSCTSK